MEFRQHRMEKILEMGNIIRLSKSCIGQEEKNAVLKVLDRELLGMGEEVYLFENALSEYFGRPAICVVNGTAALHLALLACNIGPGDEVLVPSLTYIASFQAISATGAKPIPCDVDPITLTLDIKDAENRLTSNTKAVMPVHYSGGVGNLKGMYSFARQYGLRVIEDAAHAFGTTYEGSKVGSFGDISCFSFDGIKNITSGEGGCVVTNDFEILNRVKDSRLLGVVKDSEKRYTGARSWEFDVINQGFRYHMSNIMAAIGLEQLKKFEYFSRIRTDHAKLYDNYFENNKYIKIINHDYDLVVPHIYVIQFISSEIRDSVRNGLLEKGIQTGYHYTPNHKLSFYSGNLTSVLNTTETVASMILTLPLHPDLKRDEVKYIAEEVNKLVDAKG